jgi:hypothetical protein
MENIRESERSLRRFARANIGTAYAEVAKARRSKFGEEARGLTRYLTNLSTDPSMVIQFDRFSVVDAALALAKSYASSEKAQQEDASSYIYSMVSYLINGEIYSDAMVGGDIALGGISLEKLQGSPATIARLLVDPDFRLMVYSPDGRVELSQEVLIGKAMASESDLWDWLEKHPRVAMSLRISSMRNQINNKTGFSYKISTMDLEQSIKTTALMTQRAKIEEKALKTLADRPGFYAMVAITAKMTGMKRAQLRDKMIDDVDLVIELLRGMHSWRNNTLSFVEEMARAQSLDWDAIEDAYQRGEDANRAFAGNEPGSTSIEDARPSDIRFTGDYQLGQIFHRLAEDLQKYSELLDDAGIPRLESVTPQQAAELFHLDDKETRRAYFDVIQTMSGAKTAQSTSVNGAMSKLWSGLMILAGANPEPCLAPTPDPITTEEFATSWIDHVGRKAVILDDSGEPQLLAINEVTAPRIMALSGPDGVVIEDPAMCTNILCACKRHATADASTNFGPNQTSALGRFLTIIRSLSTEGLNLKVKTVGDDGTDSIAKFDVTEIMKTGVDVEKIANGIYREHEDPMDGLAAARRYVAGVMKDAFTSMKYGDEMSLDDLVNVAQIIVRPAVTVEGEPPAIMVMQLGHVNSIISNELSRFGPDLDMDDIIAIASSVLDTAAVDAALDVESLLAGVRIPTLMKNRPGITDQRMSATERSLRLMYEIQKVADTISVVSGEMADLGKTVFDPLGGATRAKLNDLVKGSAKKSAWELDRFESKLSDDFEAALVAWDDVTHPPESDDWSFGADREGGPRITGVFTSAGKRRVAMAIGPQNAWIISSRYEDVADAIVKAYELGVTILLSGELDSDTWDKVYERTGGGLDRHQGVDKSLDGQKRLVVNTFDIRLNGGSTAGRDGSFDVAQFKADPAGLGFFAESVANEFGLSDAEFAACRSWVEKIKVNRTGEYRMKLSTMFGNLLGQRELIDVGKDGEMPYASVMDGFEIAQFIVGPVSRQEMIPVDLGVDVGPDSPVATRLEESFTRYLSRLDEIDPKTGLLPNGRPDEIIGWVAAAWGDETRYHPIRVYEADNSSGAPESFDIKGVVFDTDRQELVIDWAHGGTMEGRAFKLFEDLYSADKFIARPRTIDDIKLDDGTALSGMVARQSTLSRRGFMKRNQLMMTLMYKARTEPFGYNLADDKYGALIAHPELKEKLRTGTAMISDWTDENGEYQDLEFFPGEPGMNTFANHIARECIKFAINPTNFFASRFFTDITIPKIDGEGRRVDETVDEDWVPSNVWFNYQVLFDDNEFFQGQLMAFMHKLMPTLCPPGYEDIGGTLFNSDLKLLVPVTYTDIDGKKVTVKQWLDVYGGFHFFDEHYTGHSNSGATVKTYGPSTVNTLSASRPMSIDEINMLRGWSKMAVPQADTYHPIIGLADSDEDAF